MSPEILVLDWTLFLTEGIPDDFVVDGRCKFVFGIDESDATEERDFMVVFGSEGTTAREYLFETRKVLVVG